MGADVDDGCPFAQLAEQDLARVRIEAARRDVGEEAAMAQESAQLAP